MTTDTTKLSFITVQGSMCLITNRALRGPRRATATCTGRARTAAGAARAALSVTAPGSVGQPVATLRGAAGRKDYAPVDPLGLRQSRFSLLRIGRISARRIVSDRTGTSRRIVVDS